MFRAHFNNWFVLLAAVIDFTGEGADCFDAVRFNRIARTKINGSRVVKFYDSSSSEQNDVSICIIGGGVSGLAAALTASNIIGDKENNNIVLLESSATLGGRVQSDVTEDNYILDRGFAVFIEEYPFSKKILDYEELKLEKFNPGALVKVKGSDKLAKISDPLRRPRDTINALFSPIGCLKDKIRLLPLIFNVRRKSIEELFEEQETNTSFALRDRWGFSEKIISLFFKPFLEGIYLSPLEEQSSRMFSFVFKMFSEGAATLPAEGMGAVTKQLAEKVAASGVKLRVGKAVTRISKKDGGFQLETLDSDRIQAKTVIIATDAEVAEKLLAQLGGFEFLKDLPKQPQRSVGCLYYTFDTKAPVEEPILILNGMEPKGELEKFPVNNVCFPSVVCKSYAPEGSGLCSVTVLNETMKTFEGREDELDQAVRKQLATWFTDQSDTILNRWELKHIYNISNAQPGQFKGPLPANVNGGRPCTKYRDKELPDGLFVCGDHMATATLNGAIESGVNAGDAAAKAVIV